MTLIYYSERSSKDLDNHKLIEKFDHPNKNVLFNLSRLALSDIINTVHEQQIDWKKVELISYHQIKNQPDLTCSITHSKETSIVASCFTKNIKSLGVDLEFKSRSIKADADRFYINDNDIFPVKSDLLKWCIKEACFKALSNAGEPIKLLKDVVITNNHFYFQDKSSASKNTFRVINDEQKHIVIAYCSKNVDTNDVEIKKINHA